jgi:hypothetical protein
VAHFELTVNLATAATFLMQDTINVLLLNFLFVLAIPKSPLGHHWKIARVQRHVVGGLDVKTECGGYLPP